MDQKANMRYVGNFNTVPLMMGVRELSLSELLMMMSALY
jgi:hypothetical protein